MDELDYDDVVEGLDVAHREVDELQEALDRAVALLSRFRLNMRASANDSLSQKAYVMDISLRYIDAFFAKYPGGSP